MCSWAKAYLLIDGNPVIDSEGTHVWIKVGLGLVNRGGNYCNDKICRLFQKTHVNEYSWASDQYRNGIIKPEGTVLFSKSSSVILSMQGVTNYNNLIKDGERGGQE